MFKVHNTNEILKFFNCTANSRGQLGPGEERGAGPTVVGVLAPGTPQDDQSAHLPS